MSKRITLTDFEVEQLVNALTDLRNQTGLSYEVIHVGQRFYDSLIAKLESRKDAPVTAMAATDQTEATRPIKSGKKEEQR